MVWPAVIGAAASVAGSLLSKGGGSTMPSQVQAAKSNRQWREQMDREKYYRYEDRKWQLRNLQDTVADAKAAGLHPLFALGGSAAQGGYGGGMPSIPSPIITGQSDSGSALGSGIASAGRAIARGIPTELEKSQTMVNLARAAEINSQMKRAEMDALNVRTVPAWEEGRGEQAITHPMGTRAGVPLVRRPLSSTGRRSIPQYVEMVGPHGRRMVLNQESGLDEVSQVEYMLRPWMEQYDQWRSSRRFKPPFRQPLSSYRRNR